MDKKEKDLILHIQNAINIILISEILSAQTTASGRTSRLTSAYNRIHEIFDELLATYDSEIK